MEQKSLCCSLSPLDIYEPLCHFISIQKIKRIMPSIEGQKQWLFELKQDDRHHGAVSPVLLKHNYVKQNIKKNVYELGHFIQK